MNSWNLLPCDYFVVDSSIVGLVVLLCFVAGFILCCCVSPLDKILKETLSTLHV